MNIFQIHLKNLFIKNNILKKENNNNEDEENQVEIEVNVKKVKEKMNIF